MGYHPETLAFSFPSYPMGGVSLRGHPQPWSLGRAIYALKPWIGFDVWHIDPERRSEGQRTDDSCGWFDRRPGEYGDAVAYVLKDAEFMHEVRRSVGTRVNVISEGGYTYPRMSLSETLAVCLMVAHELEMRRWWNGQNGKDGVCQRPLRAALSKPRKVDSVAMSLALNPSDNLSSMDDPEGMVRLIAGAMHRKFKPWWKHPRWHVHHWQINFDLVRNVKRMFQPCDTCRRPLGFGYCPVSDGSGFHHHECVGQGFASAPCDSQGRAA